MDIGDIVTYAGNAWYVIDQDGEAVTLLSKDGFGSNMFDIHTNRYAESDIRHHCQNNILKRLKSVRGAKPLKTKLRDVGCEDELFLLSFEEAQRLPESIRQFPCSWWLRSYGGYANHAARVSFTGGVDIVGRNIDCRTYAVRPAMRIPVNELAR